MYPSILIQLINVISFAWVAANSLEEIPWACWRHRRGSSGLGVLPWVVWGLMHTWTGGPWQSRTVCSLGSKIKCSRGLSQVFPDGYPVGSPAKDMQSPATQENAFRHIHKKKWTDAVSQKDEKVAFVWPFPQGSLITIGAPVGAFPVSLVLKSA